MRSACWLALMAIAVGSSFDGGLPARACAEEAGADSRIPASELQRSRGGLLALYDFASASGSVVRDRAGVGKPLDLRIEKPGAVRRSAGSLEVRSKTRIRSDRPATTIIDAVRRSGELTIEAWVRPANRTQEGPARIVTLSGNTSLRNFTLGQERDRFDVRLRTTRTSSNGLPSLGSGGKSVSTETTHVVYVRDRKGRARLYVDGKERGEQEVAGDASNWDRSFHLALTNELTGDRPWRGTYYLVALYGRSLSPGEVERHFRAGPGARAALAGGRASPRRHLFEEQVAPLLADRCLECHDSGARQGGLDLSRKDRALPGGESGPAVVPNKASASLLWEFVESDEMPKGGPPLSAREKKLLREWIDGGAVWSLERIDAANYAHTRPPGNPWVRRLTRPEYIETVRSTFGVDVGEEAREILPPDLRADGFRNTGYNLNVDLKHVEAYARLAAIVVERIDVVAFAAQFQKSRRLTDDDMRGLIATMGKRVLRGPLEEREIDAFRGISTTVASSGGDFKEAVAHILEAMLQSPRFIYHIEREPGEGPPLPVGDYELAARLSYIAWGGPPDAKLMRAAADGALSDRVRVEAEVRRMLDDPRAVKRSLQFVEEWLDLRRLADLRPDREKFPDWNEALAADMRAETRAFFEEVVWKQRRPLSDLLNAQLTFATPRLAKHYGLAADLKQAAEQGRGNRSSGETDAERDDPLAQYDLTSVPARGGLLTQGSVLTVGGDEASMVSRGLFVLHDLLRGTVKDPPPCVDTTPVPTGPGRTRREIAEARLANKACGGCHARFEPLAFGLERFDGRGAYHRRDEHDNELREDGEIWFPGADGPVAYEASARLMDLLAESDRVGECLTWKVTQFALGRPLVAGDVRAVGEIHQRAQDGGGTYASLITAILLSDLVQLTHTEPER